MATISEKGHAKNVANFEELISSVASMGSAYNPSKKLLQLTSLQTLGINARKVLSDGNEAIASAKLAIAARTTSFSGLSSLARRVGNSVKATDTSEQVDASVSQIVTKIVGKRATPKKSDEEKKLLQANGESVKENSSSQMGYDNRLNNFDKLIKLVTEIPQYSPNETDLKVETLIVYYNDLYAKNAAVIAANTALQSARITRNDLYYKPKTGLVDIAVDVKTYVKSAFGASSQQYKQISKLKFVSVVV